MCEKFEKKRLDISGGVHKKLKKYQRIAGLRLPLLAEEKMMSQNRPERHSALGGRRDD